MAARSIEGAQGVTQVKNQANTKKKDGIQLAQFCEKSPGSWIGIENTEKAH